MLLFNVQHPSNGALTAFPVLRSHPHQTGKASTVEIIQGKYTRTIAAPELARLIAGYTKIFIDLGTGDGRFVLHTARQDPGIFAIGIDACRENLRESSRAAPANALFAIANVVGPDFNLVEQFGSRVAAITIHFPWGSLRDALISGDPALLAGLRKMLNPGGRVKVYLNASALVDASLDMDTA